MTQYCIHSCQWIDLVPTSLENFALFRWLALVLAVSADLSEEDHEVVQDERVSFESHDQSHDLSHDYEEQESVAEVSMVEDLPDWMFWLLSCVYYTLPVGKH